jgi:hypothetical protein
MPDVSGRVAETLRDQQRVPSLARPRLSLPRRRRTLLLVVVGVVLLALAAVAAKVVIDLGALTIDTIPSRDRVAVGRRECPTLSHLRRCRVGERPSSPRVPDAPVAGRSRSTRPDGAGSCWAGRSA